MIRGNQNQPADLTPTRVYTSAGRVYVPHYTTKTLWRGPCGNCYNEATLKTYAVPGTAMLWPRGYAL